MKGAKSFLGHLPSHKNSCDLNVFMGNITMCGRQTKRELFITTKIKFDILNNFKWRGGVFEM